MKNTKRTNKRSNAKMFGALVLSAILLAGGVAIGYGAGTHWTYKRGEIQAEQPDPDFGSSAGADGAFITNGESNGIKLLSAKIPQSAYEANGISPLADTAFTLTATIEPLGSTDYFEWTISNNDDNAITMTVSDDNARAVVTCNKAFDVQKVISITSTANPAVTASCTVDYYKRLQSVTFEMPTIKLNTTETTYTVEPKAVYGIGTVEDTVITVSSGTIACAINVQNISYSNYGGIVKFSESVTFTGNSFSLIMSPDSKPSFCTTSISGPSNVMYANVFKNFVSTLSNPNSSANTRDDYHYTIDVRWSAKRAGGTFDSGTVKVKGKFDISALVVNADDVGLSDDNIIF